MKVQSFEQPDIIEPVGNGSYRYRFNITEIIPEDSERRPYWEYDEVIVWQPFSANDITKAVIEYLWPASYEQKLLNEYNAAQLGVYDADKAKKKIADYKSFLDQREAVKEKVDKDYKKMRNYDLRF